MSLTLLLIIGTVALSFYSFSNQELLDKLVHNPSKVSKYKEYYRLLSSGFVHADYMHLLLNMYALYIFGEVVEETFVLSVPNGKFYFFGLYILGIILANVPDLIKNSKNPYFNSLGASGGVSSVVFASIIISPLSKLFMFPIPIPIPAYIFAVIYVLYSIYMDKRQGDKINHLAHLWGGVWGVVFMVIAFPDAINRFFNLIVGSLQ